MNCKYYFQHNGETFEFNSEQELSSFIVDNKNRLDILDIRSDIQFSRTPSEFKQQDENYAKIIKINNDNKAMDTSINEKGEKDAKLSGYVSVTKAITDPLYGVDGSPFITGFNDVDYIKNKIETLLTQKNPDTGSNYTTEEAQKFVDNLIENWAKIAKIGTAFHNIAELYFSEPRLTASEIVARLKQGRKLSDVNFKDSHILESINVMGTIENQLRQKHGANARFFPELKLRVKNEMGAFVGKIDLVVLDEAGVPHIYDFKASPAEYHEFKQVKKLTFDYQLAFYKQMLAAHGFNVHNAQLGIIPIQLAQINYDDMSFGAVNFSTIDIRNDGFNQAMNPKTGYVTKNIERLIPNAELSFQMTTTKAETLSKLDKELFGYTPHDRLTISEWEKFKQEKIYQNSSGKWSFVNILANTPNERYKAYDTREQAEEAAKAYYKKITEEDIYFSEAVASEYHLAESREGAERVFDFTKVKKQFYDKYFSPYLERGFKLKDDLLTHGILTFYHPVYKTIDFVYITNSDLKDDKKLAFGHNGKKITGNLIPDNEVPAGTIKSTIGNIELMRVMSIINDFMPNIEGGYLVKDVKVINQYKQTMAYQTTDVLKENFKYLVHAANRKKKLGLVNNFENDSIKLVDPVSRFISELDSVLEGSLNRNERFLNEIKGKTNTVGANDIDGQINQLIDIFNSLTEATTGPNQSFVKTASNVEIDKLSNLAYHCADAIRELKQMRIEHQLTDVGIVGMHTDYFSPSQLSAIKAINEVEKEILIHNRGETTRILSKALTELKVKDEAYLDAEGSLDVSLRAFDECVVVDEEAKSIQTKNPYDGGDFMEPYQKEYLKEWLKDINAIRYPNTKGDVNSEEGKKLVESGEWFEVPLIRGGVYERGWKGVKDNFKDLLEKAKHPLETISKEQKKEKNEQLNKFEKYINPTKMDDGVRISLLNDKGTNYFSKNLSEIRSEMVYHDTLEKQYQKVLPFIKIGLMVTYAVSAFTNSEIDEIKNVMLKKYQSSVYEVNHIPQNLMPIYQVYTVASTFSNVFALVGNPISFAREMATGRYNNYFKLLARFAGENSPSAMDLTKGYAYVDSKGIAAIAHQNILNGFNMRYNLAGRSISEIKNNTRPEKNVFLGQIFKSNSYYFLNQLPDYEHRMALFMAFLYKENCVDAYSYDEKTQSLVYDMDKDPRFKGIKEYAKTGKLPSDGGKNIAKYNMMLEEFNKHRPSGEKLKFGDNLPDGITEREVESIKNISNQIHGNMDSDTAMHANRYFWGKILLKFQQFVGAKWLNYALTPDKYTMTDHGYAVDPETGDPLWAKAVRDPSTGEIHLEPTTNYDESIKQRYIEFHTRQEAGVFYAMRDVWTILTDKENRAMNIDVLKNDPAKMAGLKFMIADSLFLLVCLIAALSIDIPEMRKDEPVTADLLRSFVNMPQENNPFLIINNVLGVVDPSALAINAKVFNNTVRFVTSDNYETSNYFYNSFGLGKWSGFIQ